MRPAMKVFREWCDKSIRRCHRGIEISLFYSSHRCKRKCAPLRSALLVLGTSSAESVYWSRKYARNNVLFFFEYSSNIITHSVEITLLRSGPSNRRRAAAMPLAAMDEKPGSDGRLSLDLGRPDGRQPLLELCSPTAKRAMTRASSFRCTRQPRRTCEPHSSIGASAPDSSNWNDRLSYPPAYAPGRR